MNNTTILKFHYDPDQQYPLAVDDNAGSLTNKQRRASTFNDLMVIVREILCRKFICQERTAAVRCSWCGALVPVQIEPPLSASTFGQLMIPPSHLEGKVGQVEEYMDSYLAGEDVCPGSQMLGRIVDLPG